MTDRDRIEQIIVFVECLHEDTEHLFNLSPEDFEGRLAAILKVKAFIKGLVGEARYKEVSGT